MLFRSRTQDDIAPLTQKGYGGMDCLLGIGPILTKVLLGIGPGSAVYGIENTMSRVGKAAAQRHIMVKLVQTLVQLSQLPHLFFQIICAIYGRTSPLQNNLKSDYS